MCLRARSFCIPAFFVYCGLVSAENKISVVANIGNSAQLGYKRPDIGVSAGVERYKKHFWFHVTGKFSPTDKVFYGDVTQSGVTGELFWNNRRGLFIGGGGRLRNIRFHDLGESHWIYGPTVGGGWLMGGLKIIVRGHAFERDARYDFSGVSWGATYDLKGRLRLGFEHGFYRFKPNWSDWKLQNAFVGSVVVGFVF